MLVAGRASRMEPLRGAAAIDGGGADYRAAAWKAMSAPDSAFAGSGDSDRTAVTPALFAYRRISWAELGATWAAAMGLTLLQEAVRQRRTVADVAGGVNELSLLQLAVLAVKFAAFWLGGVVAHGEAFRRPATYAPADVALPSSQFLQLEGMQEKVHCLVDDSESSVAASSRRTSDTASSKPLLVHLSHGFGACSLSFAPAMKLLGAARLKRKRCRIAAQDATGFGLSERPGIRSRQLYTVTSQVQQTRAAIAALREPLGEEADVLLVGHSMGGYTAAATAVDELLSKSGAGGRSKTLVLVAPAIFCPFRSADGLDDPAGGPEPGRWARLQRRVHSATSEALVLFGRLAFALLAPVIGIVLRRIVASEGFWRKGLRAAYGKAPATGGDDVAEGALLRYRWPSLTRRWDMGMLLLLYARVFVKGTGKADKGSLGPASVMRIMRNLVRGIRRAATEQNLRVLIVHGVEDNVVPIENSRMLRDLIPGAQLLEVEGVGHCPHEENPEAFVSAVQSFESGTFESSSFKWK